MEGRNGSAGPEVDEALSEKAGLLETTEAPAQVRGGLGAWRDWSLLRKWSKLNVLYFSKLNVLYFFLFGSGFLLGVAAAVHVMGYFKGGPGLPEQWSSRPKVVEPTATPKNESLMMDTPKNESLMGTPRYEPLMGTPKNESLTGTPEHEPLMGLDHVDFHHNMTDEELFWRASIAPHRPGWAPAKSSRKIAFMFLITDTLPLAPLWEKYFRGGEDLYTIYVHSLPWATLDVPPTSVFYGRQIPSQLALWGTVSLVDASRRLLANALLDFTNERFVLLSESGIPVSNLTTFYNAAIDSPVSFTSSYDDHGKAGRGRWSRQMEPEVDLKHWRKGSEWFEVKRSHAIFIVSDVLYYPKFRDFCGRGHCFPDEHYIPTILHIHFDTEISHLSVTFVDWAHAKGAHPVTFDNTTTTEGLLKEIVDSRGCPMNGEGQPCFFFARKFSPNTLEALLNLAPTVLGIM